METGTFWREKQGKKITIFRQQHDPTNCTTSFKVAFSPPAHIPLKTLGENLLAAVTQQRWSLDNIWQPWAQVQFPAICALLHGHVE